MPFKSKAQRRKFAELLVNGKITDEAYERWNQTTGRKELPERVKPKKKAKTKAAAGGSRTRRAAAASAGKAKGSGAASRT